MSTTYSALPALPLQYALLPEEEAAKAKARSAHRFGTAGQAAG